MFQKPNQYIGKYFLFVGFITALFSCKKENGPWWEADFSGPIAHSELNIFNLLPDSILVSDPDSALRIAYTQTIFDYKVDSLVSIPDTTLSSFYITPFGPVAFTASQQLFSTAPAETYFDISDASLTKIILKKGMIKLEAGNSISEPVVFKYDILKSDLAGIPFSINEEVPAGSSSAPGTITRYIPADGLSIDLTGINSDKFNTIITKSAVIISPTANSGSISAGQGLTVKITFMDIVPLYAKGYMGKQFFTNADTLDFEFLKGMKADYFALQSADINMSISNGFGADISASNIKLTSVNSTNSNSVVLAGSGVFSSYNLNRAFYTGAIPNPVNPNIKNFPLNASNSNIKNFIENLPDKIIYSADIEVNPYGNISGNNDFLYYGYGFKTDLEIDIPLAFAAVNLRLQDTVDFKLGTVAQADNINDGLLTLKVENGYPFDAAIQGFICDDNFNVVDSLFTSPNTAVAAFTDANYKVTSAQASLLYIPLTKEKIEKIQSAKKIIFTVRMNTVSSPQIVKIYDYYKINLLLTGDVNYSVNKK
jgi:hypothetical protein